MYPIIALWSHPRSMSTAMERIMRERGDMDCAHEPFMYDYYTNRKIREMPHFEVDQNHPVTYEGIRDMLLGRAEKQPVFFKDMSYYVMPQICKDKDFCMRLTHCFLIRNPVASIPSYHKLDADVTLEEIGLEAQWLHFQALETMFGEGMFERAPVVIQAESVRADTRGAMKALWEHIGLSYVEKAFDWDAESSKPEDWKQVSGWHGDVASSRSIRALSADEVAAQKSKFQEQAKKFPHLQGYLDHHEPFYSKLKARAITL